MQVKFDVQNCFQFLNPNTLEYMVVQSEEDLKNVSGDEEPIVLYSNIRINNNLNFNDVFGFKTYSGYNCIQKTTLLINVPNIGTNEDKMGFITSIIYDQLVGINPVDETKDEWYYNLKNDRVSAVITLPEKNLSLRKYLCNQLGCETFDSLTYYFDAYYLSDETEGRSLIVDKLKNLVKDYHFEFTEESFEL